MDLGDEDVSVQAHLFLTNEPFCCRSSIVEESIYDGGFRGYQNYLMFSQFCCESKIKNVKNSLKGLKTNIKNKITNRAPWRNRQIQNYCQI